MKTCAAIAGSGEFSTMDCCFLLTRLTLLYYDFGVRKLMCGVNRGMELSFLDFILNERASFPELKIDGVFTHEEEANTWEEKDRELLYRAIARCDEELILKPVFGSEMLFQRNIVMMDLADLVLLIGRDRETEFWAGKLMKPLLKIDFEKKRMIPEISLLRYHPEPKPATDNIGKPQH